MVTWSRYLRYIRDVKHLKCTKGNINVYRGRHRLINAYFTSREFTRRAVDTLLSSIKRSNSTKNNTLKVIKNICHAMIYYGTVSPEIDLILTIPYFEKKNLRQIDILTAQEIKAIAELRLPYKKRRIEINKRWRAIIYTLALGLRIGEIIALVWKDYHDNYFVVGECGKTQSSYRKVYIPDKLRRIIDDLPHYPHGYIFGSHQGPLYRESASEELKTRAHVLGINKVIYPHVLRHSFIVLALESGMPIQDVMAHVGHKDPKVTIEYAHIGLAQTKRVVDASPIYRSNMLETTKELLKSKIDRVYDVRRLKSIESLLAV